MEEIDVGEGVVRVPDEVKRYFAYDSFRKYQDAMATVVYESLQNRRQVVLESSTGSGKTSAILAAALPTALQKNLKILWAVRTHQQILGVLSEIQKLKRAKVKAIGLFGRQQLCLFEPVKNTPQVTFNATCQATKNANKCPYFSMQMRSMIQSSSPTVDWFLQHGDTPGELKRAFKQAGFCPYEGLLLALPKADVVIVTYNYLMTSFMRSLLYKRIAATPERTLLIIDEAHNVYRLATQSGVQSTSLKTMEKTAQEAIRYGFEDIAQVLNNAYSELLTTKLQDGEATIEKKVFDLNVGDVTNAGRHVQEQKLLEKKVPKSYLLALGDFLSRALDEDTLLLLTRTGKRRRLEAINLDPLKVMQPIFRDVYASVSMSGTLRPLEAYAKVAGLLEDTVGLTVPYPFPEEHLQVVVARGVSTRLKERNEALYYKIHNAIQRLYTHYDTMYYGARFPVGTAAFFASHDLLNGFIDYTEAKGLSLPGEVFVEKRFMDSSEVHELFNGFAEACSRTQAMLLAVQGARLAEGVDYFGNMLKTIVIVGVPYAKPTPRIKAQIEYFEKLFPGHGRTYAYVVPALWSALQAAGRGIRSENDICQVIFLDERFLKLRRMIPRWMLSRLKTSDIERLVTAYR